jgi:hypothetical protein
MPDPAPLFPVVRSHLEALSDDIGLMQHAVGARPDPRHGYCTDDVARALSVDVLHASELGWAAVAPSVARAVRFIRAAGDPATGRFRNFRAADGTWLPGTGSEDAHARALRSLAQLAVAIPDPGLRSEAVTLFEWALPAAVALSAWRPRAAALLACVVATEAGWPSDTAAAALRSLAEALWATVEPIHVDSSWPWPDPVATYENGLLPEALLRAGACLGDVAMVDRGRQLLGWLIDAQTAPAGHLSPIGNAGWWRRGGPPARFDQQPIEATALLQAARAAFAVTGDTAYEDVMERCYGWFLGRNDGGADVAIPALGACHDGLTATGPNANQGAESTLMWLTAVESIRDVRAARRDLVGSGAKGHA